MAEILHARVNNKLNGKSTGCKIVRSVFQEQLIQLSNTSFQLFSAEIIIGYKPVSVRCQLTDMTVCIN
jgi:hypothetical protein